MARIDGTPLRVPAGFYAGNKKLILSLTGNCVSSKVAEMSLKEKNKLGQATLSRFESHHGEGAVPAEEDTWTKAMESEPRIALCLWATPFVLMRQGHPTPQRHEHTNFTTKVVRVHL